MLKGRPPALTEFTIIMLAASAIRVFFIGFSLNDSISGSLFKPNSLVYNRKLNQPVYFMGVIDL